ncbi:hypothetical protein [Propionicimonas sp.]|uniref:hypothetical protein n=1 Tax=Propionicimonas sp. TaxID=1955623 RepID=UPI0017BB9549|nr:hypothetical protein [Propionicimonas sp.]MBA3019641.1 hypothetical protein [Propionicimonas sp.]MBU4208014.1 hypothetical protein [Actinomycetota bacterium]MBU4411448.1 hypothetical protein [Actinomycetota bacterium]MCG2805760.1 hypothetical protein [Propionicimonas sp.]
MPETTTSRIYTTLADLVDQEIIGAFVEYGTDYDIDGLVQALRDADHITYINTVPLDQQGFQLSIDSDTFWALAAKFDRAAK